MLDHVLVHGGDCIQALDKMFKTLSFIDNTHNVSNAPLQSSDQHCPLGGALTEGEQPLSTLLHASSHIFISTQVPERKQIWHNPENSTAFSTYSI